MSIVYSGINIGICLNIPGFAYAPDIIKVTDVTPSFGTAQDEVGTGEPYKSAGPSGITPVMLQMTRPYVIPHLAKLN